MKHQSVFLYGKEFLVFSNLAVTEEVIRDMIVFASRSRMKYRRRSWWFTLTRRPVCWQIEEMLIFTVNNSKHYGGLSIGLVEAKEWKQYREKIKEAYGENSVTIAEELNAGTEGRGSRAQCVVVGNETDSSLFS